MTHAAQWPLQHNSPTALAAQWPLQHSQQVPDCTHTLHQDSAAHTFSMRHAAANMNPSQQPYSCGRIGLSFATHSWSRLQIQYSVVYRTAVQQTCVTLPMMMTAEHSSLLKPSTHLPGKQDGPTCACSQTRGITRNTTNPSTYFCSWVRRKMGHKDDVPSRQKAVNDRAPICSLWHSAGTIDWQSCTVTHIPTTHLLGSRHGQRGDAESREMLHFICILEKKLGGGKPFSGNAATPGLSSTTIGHLGHHR